jgi:hypothetical protein
MSSIQDFFLVDNTSQLLRVYSNSQVFTTLIFLQQNALSQRVYYTIENYNLYNLLNNTQDDWRCVIIMRVRFYTLMLKYEDLI